MRIDLSVAQLRLLFDLVERHAQDWFSSGYSVEAADLEQFSNDAQTLYETMDLLRGALLMANAKGSAMQKSWTLRERVKAESQAD